jgi:acyl transferase domain-containing protein/acyl carrier protein
MMAPDGRCKFGDARADGYVRSEGAGLVVLKPLSKALVDGDPIYAVIRGSAVNNDGRSSGFLATPGRAGQEDVLRRAYQDAGIAPSHAQYVEAHGTGTRAGDPVELGALGAVLAAGRPQGRPCAVGSIKTNFGHTEGAAGVAGLIKVALALKHRAIPASLHMQEPNPDIPWRSLNLMVPTKLMPWPDDVELATAGVSSFGIAGTNAHIVLTEAPAIVSAHQTRDHADGACLMPLSAHTPEALATLARAYKAFITADTAPSLKDISHSAACHRTHHPHRLALVAESWAEMAEQLDAFLQGEMPSDASFDQKEVGGQHKVVYVFPGQGSQWNGMGRQLLANEPVFRQTLEQCEQAMRPFVDWSLLEQMTAEQTSPVYRLDEIDVVQPTLLSIEIALAKLWRSWGIEPDAVIGHSMGEVAAAHVAGALSLDDAMRVICRRSQLLRRTSGQGAMAVVELSVEEAQAALAGYEDRLSVAVSNSPRSTVLSGDPSALSEVIQSLERRDIFCRLIKVDVASHSPQMDPLKADLLIALEGMQPCTSAVPIYSTALGIVTDGADFDATYWAQNLRQPVLFSKMVQQLLATAHTVFIELSPHPILLPAIQQGFQSAGCEGIALPSLRRNEAESATVLNSLGLLYTLGYSVNWERLYPAGGQYVKLPLYPWQRERFWFEPPAAKGRRFHPLPGRHPLLGDYTPAATGAHVWQNELSLEAYPFLNDHRVQGTAVLPAAVYVEMALVAAREAFGAGPHTLEKMAFKEALSFSAEDVRTVQIIITPDMPGTVTCQFFSRPAGQAVPPAWTHHASASIRLAQAGATASPPDQVEIGPPHAEEATPGATHYQAMLARGLDYGPRFRGIARLWRDTARGAARAELYLPESVNAAAGAFLVDPALLDACFQLLLATLDDDGCPSAADTYLPVGLDSLQLYGELDPGRTLPAYAVRRPSDEGLTGDVFLLGEAEQVIMAAHGLRFQRMKRDTRVESGEWLYELQWQLQPSLEHTIAKPDQAGIWLIFADRSSLAQQLAAKLEALGETCVMVSPGPTYQGPEPLRCHLNPAHPAEFQQLLKEVLGESRSSCRGIIHLWGLDSEATEAMTLASLKSAQEYGPISVLHLIQALNLFELDPSPRLWLLTRGAQAAGRLAGGAAVAQAPLWGLGRVIALEHPELHCTCIDLSLGDPDPEVEAEALFRELWSASQEEQIALRDNGRYVARLVRHQLETPDRQASEIVKAKAAPGQAYRLEMPTPGILDSLTLRATTRQQPAPGQVEIQVYVVGLNFIDVMKAMGIYPGLDPDAPVALGAECAGKITAVGDGVSGLKVGDDVMAITPSFDKTSFFSAYVTISAELVVPKPAQLTFEEAATVPIAFLTAYYAMYYLGQLDKGERVLIHSAAGGVGLAAVQLAKLAGAEIFVTAGTPEKRAYLGTLGIEHIMDSRSLAFAKEVMAQTASTGVDMVLNSLTGEAMQHSLSVLGTQGRFLEIGKRDIYQNHQLGLEPFKKSLSFFSIDLARLVAERPSFVMSLLREVIQYFEERSLHPLPMKVFCIADITDAFRTMAQAKHIGKIVISLRDPPAILPSSVTALGSVRPDVTYLITGGLGGLGLTVAKWLVEQGARHLILLGRRGPSAAAQALIEELAAAGAQVVVAQADVAQGEAVAGVLAGIKQTMPPLRGVIHAAGILDDGSLLQLNGERFERVTAPKIDGTWNLHILTQDIPLDFFICFSSVTALLGTPGQGNYAAANAFLDALAHYRHAQGQPALSINWGPWAEVGLAAAQANRGERLALRGIASITPRQGIAALAQLFQSKAAQIAVMPFNFQQWSEFYPAAGRSLLFSQLQEVKPDAVPKPPESGIREALLAVEPGRRRQALFEAHLREQVAHVLRLVPARVPLNKPLKSLGLDSLMALELRNRLEMSLQVTLSATLIWNYPTIAELAPYLAGKMGVPLTAEATSPAPTPDGGPKQGEAVTPLETLVDDDELADTLSELEPLSQDDVEALLADELAAIDDLLD